MTNLKESLINELKQPLPGKAAQQLMSPELRGEENVSADTVLRHSSVLILLYPTSKGITIPFIQRPEYNGVHSGQVSLPGGKCEKEDASYWKTALRETREELGISTDKVEKFGNLSPLFIYKSNYIVMPQVGYLDEAPIFSPDPIEVSEVFEVPVLKFISPSNIKYFKERLNGSIHNIPFFDVEGKCIWGATAMILSELMEIFRRCSPKIF